MATPSPGRAGEPPPRYQGSTVLSTQRPRGRARPSPGARTRGVSCCLQRLKLRRTRAQSSSIPGSTSLQTQRKPRRRQRLVRALGTKSRRPECKVELQLPEPFARHGTARHRTSLPRGTRGTHVKQPSAIRAVSPAMRPVWVNCAGVLGPLENAFLGTRKATSSGLSLGSGPGRSPWPLLA